MTKNGTFEIEGAFCTKNFFSKILFVEIQEYGFHSSRRRLSFRVVLGPMVFVLQLDTYFFNDFKHSGLQQVSRRLVCNTGQVSMGCAMKSTLKLFSVFSVNVYLFSKSISGMSFKVKNGGNQKTYVFEKFNEKLFQLSESF